MSFATISLLAVPNTSEFILLTAALEVFAGLIAVLAGLLEMGRVAQFFSESVKEDVFVGPTEAVVALLSSHFDEADIQELLISEVESFRTLLQASFSSGPPERQASLPAILDSLDRLMDRIRQKPAAAK
jgi:hypothetical protein